ncbi:hypothetical protein Bca4012_098015 [Brassica carinata]
MDFVQRSDLAQRWLWLLHNHGCLLIPNYFRAGGNWMNFFEDGCFSSSVASSWIDTSNFLYFCDGGSDTKLFSSFVFDFSAIQRRSLNRRVR